MQMMLTAENAIRLDIAGDEFEIISEEVALSPYHLLAAGLASCTALTVQSWANAAGIDSQGLTMSIAWTVASERPRRITHMDMQLHWPGLPPHRVAAAERAADLCPIHETLERATEITCRVVSISTTGGTHG